MLATEWQDAEPQGAQNILEKQKSLSIDMYSANQARHEHIMRGPSDDPT